jgi:hypothetical protein
LGCNWRSSPLRRSKEPVEAYAAEHASASAGSQEPAPADDLQDRYDAAVDALTAIRDHGKTPEFPCHAMFKGDCEDTMRETARAMLAWLSSGDGTEGS